MIGSNSQTSEQTLIPDMLSKVGAGDITAIDNATDVLGQAVVNAAMNTIPKEGLPAEQLAQFYMNLNKIVVQVINIFTMKMMAYEKASLIDIEQKLKAVKADNSQEHKKESPYS